jgi:hypothetical protein
MRNPSSLALLVSVMTIVASCGGRSDKHDDAASGAAGGSEATSGAGGTHAGAGSGTGGDPGTGGTTGGTGAGTGGNAAGTGGTSAGSGGARAGSGGGSCDDLVSDYSSAYDEAVQCDPNAFKDECTQKIEIGLSCGCESYVNPAQSDALARMSAAQQAYADRACRSGNVCGQCLAPARGQCSDAGRCEDVPAGLGRSCKVAGTVYPDGADDIPDPSSCNTCSCYDGALACTEIGGCEKPCPDGQGFGTDCASCGPTDACEIPEYDCFPRCSNGECAGVGELCVSGLCVSGLCG